MAAVRTWYLPAPCTSLSVQAHTSPHEGVIFAAALDAPLPGIRLYSLAHRAALLPSQLTGPAEPSLLASRATTDSVLVHSTVADGANVIVSGDRAGNVTIQARQGENSELHVLQTLKAHRGAVTAAASGHASLATAGADGTVQVRALGSLSDAPLAIYSEPAASVTSLAWVSPHILAATGAGARLSLVDFRSHTSAGRLIESVSALFTVFIYLLFSYTYSCIFGLPRVSLIDRVQPISTGLVAIECSSSTCDTTPVGNGCIRRRAQSVGYTAATRATAVCHGPTQRRSLCPHLSPVARQHCLFVRC